MPVVRLLMRRMIPGLPMEGVRGKSIVDTRMQEIAFNSILQRSDELSPILGDGLIGQAAAVAG
jgi:hypothetical protein